MKKYLAHQDRVCSPSQLQAQLDRFVQTTTRFVPTRPKGRRTPAEAFGARIKVTPAGAPKAPFSHYPIRRDRVDGTGKVTLRYEGKRIRLGSGRAHERRRVIQLVADRDVRVLSEQGELLSHLTIDPYKDYQPFTYVPCRGTVCRFVCPRCLATSQSGGDGSRTHEPLDCQDGLSHVGS